MRASRMAVRIGIRGLLTLGVLVALLITSVLPGPRTSTDPTRVSARLLLPTDLPTWCQGPPGTRDWGFQVELDYPCVAIHESKAPAVPDATLAPGTIIQVNGHEARLSWQDVRAGWTPPAPAISIDRMLHIDIQQPMREPSSAQVPRLAMVQDGLTVDFVVWPGNPAGSPRPVAPADLVRMAGSLRPAADR